MGQSVGLGTRRERHVVNWQASQNTYLRQYFEFFSSFVEINQTIMQIIRNCGIYHR